jgi:uncharacterized protein (TIGR03083 family)
VLDKADYLSLLESDSAELIAAAEGNFELPVPSCPGWHVVDLVVHVGAVHRAQAKIVATRATQASGIQKEMFLSVPGLLEWLENSALFGKQSDLASVPAGIAGWFSAGSAELLTALTDADQDDAVWSWSADKSVTHYLRMMPIETAVHRWDAQAAVGRPEPIAANLAADGIGHTFEVMVPMRRAARPAAPGEGQTYRWEGDAFERSWTTQFQRDEVILTRADDKPADLIVRGSASDLLLFLWRRIPASELTVTGEVRLLDSYFSLVPPI